MQRPRPGLKPGTSPRQRLIGPVACLLLVLAAASSQAQARRTTSQSRTRKPAPAAKPIVAQPDVICPAVLGIGVNTHREFCDVLVGRDPHTGIIIVLPSHRGPLVLTFDLHNRETYSEELIREGRAYAHHTATIGVLTMDGDLLTRAVVDTEFRNATDLLDRVSGGAGPTGTKAVAPIGDEPIRVEIPEGIDAVSVLGEKLLSITPDGKELFTAPGRPIAIISDVAIEYRPAPPPKKPTTKTSAKKKR